VLSGCCCRPVLSAVAMMASTTPRTPVPSGQASASGCSDEESVSADDLPSTRRRYMGVAAAAGMLALGTLGLITAKSLASDSASIPGDSSPLEAATGSEFVKHQPEFVKHQRAPQSAARFLASEELMAVVAKHSISSNPHCQSNGSRDLPSVCDATALTPLLVAHMSKHVNGLPRILSEKLASLEMDSNSQEAVMAGTHHLADPELPALARAAVGALQEANRSASGVAVRRLNDALKPHSSKMTQLRAKLFPNMHTVDPSVAHQTVQTVLTAHGLHVRKETEKPGGWNVDFHMTMPTGRGSLKSALQSMPSGRELAPALFAPGTAPLKESAPIGGPPPPDDLAGDVCAALMLPLTHLVMACLHHDGKLTLPFWAKVTITVEDALFLGVNSFLPLIGLIIDMVFIWTPRGYVVTPGAEYPKDFLNPNSPTAVS